MFGPVEPVEINHPVGRDLWSVNDFDGPAHSILHADLVQRQFLLQYSHVNEDYLYVTGLLCDALRTSCCSSRTS